MCLALGVVVVELRGVFFDNNAADDKSLHLGRACAKIFSTSVSRAGDGTAFS